MNQVNLIGRLTKDIELRYTSDTQKAVAKFSIAIDRGKDKDGNDRGADFPSVTVFGKTAENCEKFLKKGSQIAIQGRLQTGSYDKDGKKYYTTDVIADRVEFLGSRSGNTAQASEEPTQNPTPQGFAEIDEDIPF